ncbi:hypothetical protein RB653_000800 [Dictyostelium firmibasis]|uniref:Uncharacterized protein n=1 Tax=Dictyostelium firmibasis TaxID=79012 RepID=A0AAN7YW75_9MYCE
MGLKNMSNLEDDNDDENYVGEDSNILNILDRIDTNIVLAKNNVVQPLKTSKGDNKVEKPTDDGSNTEIKVPSSVYKKPEEPQITTIGSMYAINSTSKPTPKPNNSNITKQNPNKTATLNPNNTTPTHPTPTNPLPSINGTKLIDLD